MIGIKLLLDENVDLRLLSFFTSAYDVKSIVRDYTPGLSDEEVLEIATQEKRMLITHDKDHGELIIRWQLPHCGVLLFRLKDESLENVQNRLHFVLTQYKDQLHHFLVITQEHIRIRKNPSAI